MARLCPSCLTRHDGDEVSRCRACAASLRLHDRFVLAGVLASKGKSRVFVAEDLHSRAPVVIKELSLVDIDAWKEVELFERAARVLGSLTHPGIPAQLDHWTELRGGVTHYFMAQEFIPGGSLAQARSKLGWPHAYSSTTAPGFAARVRSNNAA